MKNKFLNNRVILLVFIIFFSTTISGFNKVNASANVVPLEPVRLNPMYNMGSESINVVYQDEKEFNHEVGRRAKQVAFFTNKDVNKAKSYIKENYDNIFPQVASGNSLNYETYFRTGWLVWGIPHGGPVVGGQNVYIGYNLVGRDVANIQYPETEISPNTAKWLDWKDDKIRGSIKNNISINAPKPEQSPTWHNPIFVMDSFPGLTAYNLDGSINGTQTRQNAQKLINTWLSNIENRYNGSKTMLIDLPNLNSVEKMGKYFQISTPPTDVSYGLATGWFQTGTHNGKPTYSYRTFRIAPVVPYDLYFVKNGKQGISDFTANGQAHFKVDIKNGGVYPVEKTSISLIYETEATTNHPQFSNEQIQEMAKRALSHSNAGGWDGNSPKEITSNGLIYKVFSSKKMSTKNTNLATETFGIAKKPDGNYRIVHRVNEQRVNIGPGGITTRSFNVSGYHNEEVPYKAFSDVNVYISYVPEKSFLVGEDGIGNMVKRTNNSDFVAESVELSYNKNSKVYDVYMKVQYTGENGIPKYDAADPTTKRVHFKTTYSIQGASSPTGTVVGHDGAGWEPNAIRTIRIGSINLPASARGISVTSEVNHDRQVLESNYANNMAFGSLTLDGGTFKGSIVHFPKLKNGAYSTYVVYAYTKWPEGQGDTIKRRIKGYRISDTLTHDFVYDLEKRTKTLVFDREITFTKAKPYYAREITFPQPTKDKEQTGFLVIVDDDQETAREAVIGVNSATHEQWKAGISWSSIDSRLDDLPWAKIKADFGVERAAWNLGKHNVRDEKTRADKPSILK